MNERSGRNMAVIGAGMAGCTVARTLSDHGHSVTVFEKSRGPGGRMARRQRGPYEWDFGTQYFTARHPIFQERVRHWLADGIVSEWQMRLAAVSFGESGHPEARSLKRAEPRYAPAQSMTQLCKELCRGIDLRTSRKVLSTQRIGSSWFLLTQISRPDPNTSDELRRIGPFDLVVVATPAAQAAPLLDEAPQLREAARRVLAEPCWAALVGMTQPVPLPYDGAFIEDPTLAWVARNNSKPNRELAESWVLHATPSWSIDHLEMLQVDVAQRLFESFRRLLPAHDWPSPGHLEAHRWRYARTLEPGKTDSLWDADLGIGACGDWCRGVRVEDAFLSGLDLSTRILTT